MTTATAPVTTSSRTLGARATTATLHTYNWTVAAPAHIIGHAALLAVRTVAFAVREARKTHAPQAIHDLKILHKAAQASASGTTANEAIDTWRDSVVTDILSEFDNDNPELMARRLRTMDIQF